MEGACNERQEGVRYGVFARVGGLGQEIRVEAALGERCES
jgi:hypothetical protein